MVAPALPSICVHDKIVPGQGDGAMSKLVGYYPGSSDPPTDRHLDVIERA
jgi:hypothetical protein